MRTINQPEREYKQQYFGLKKTNILRHKRWFSWELSSRFIDNYDSYSSYYNY